MAKSLLEGVNEVLRIVRITRGQSGALTSLTDSSRQGYIDNAVIVLNEVVEQLYDKAQLPLPQELGEGTITLVTDDRDYAMDASLVILRFPLLDETNGQLIREYPGGYQRMVTDQLFPANYTGLPLLGAIRPTDGQLYLDRIPTADENGLIYKYRYDKDVSLSAAADVFPFTDTTFRAVVPAAVELWKRRERREFDDALFNVSMGRASRALRQLPPRTSWLRG